MICSQRANHKSPAVRLHISLTGEAEHPQEVIRKVTADYEVVDVDGFIFKRKRKAVHLEEEAVEPEGNCPALQEEHQITEQSRVEPATSNPASNQEILQAVWGLEPDSAKQHALTLLATISPDEDPQQALPALSERLAMSAVQAAGIPDSLKEALAGAWPAAVSASVRNALKNGTLACGEPNAAQRAAQRAAEVVQAKQMRKAALQARLESLLAEEKEWLKLAEEHKRLAAEVGLPVQDAPEEQEAAPQQETLALAQRLVQAREVAHCQVTLQVEGLCAMVSGVEELVGCAERQCTAMQARWHREKFRKFTHVDSPACLIQEIIRPSRRSSLASPTS